MIQVSVWSIGTAVLAIAVAGLYIGYPSAEPVAAVSSLLLFAAMVLFAYFVFSPRLGAASALDMKPAE